MAKKVVSKGKVTPMQRVERFRARRDKVAASSPPVKVREVRESTPKLAPHVVRQLPNVVGSGQTPQTAASWLEQMETKIVKALRRGEFHRCHAFVVEVEKKGLNHNPEDVVSVGLDDFLHAYFDPQMASVLARNGVLMFRQLLALRPDQLLALDGVGPLWADRLIAFCREHFHWRDGPLSTKPNRGYRPSGVLPPGEKQQVNREFVE